MNSWEDTDKTLPVNKEYVKVRVADFSGDYKTIAFYNESDFKWYDKNGNCLNDNVYAWKF